MSYGKMGAQLHDLLIDCRAAILSQPEPGCICDTDSKWLCPVHKEAQCQPGPQDTELRDRIAKAIWDAEIVEENRRERTPDKKWAPWPKDSAIQLYCQSTYRLADAVLAVVQQEIARAQKGKP